MARVHRFTLKAAARNHDGQRVTRGHTITLPVGSPGVSALQADPAWDHTMIAAPEPRGRAAAQAKAQAALDVPRKSAAAFTGLANRLTGSIEDVEAMTPAERLGFAAMISGNRGHLIRSLERLGLLELLEVTGATTVDAPELGDGLAAGDSDYDAPPATEPEAPAPLAASVVDAELTAEIRAAATAKAAREAADLDRGIALQSLQAKLLTPGNATMAHLVKLAKLAGLEVPEDLAKGRDRATLITGLAELIATAPTTRTVSTQVDPQDLG